MERKVTSLKVDPELWKQAKKLAIDRGISLAELVEELLKKELKKQ
ncbi:MAG: ribbon-helix-helix protein, CopG family [Candidatus Aenigmatarchaeota archaeon]|nr:ribbon-helix-helix protein, CopG family [Candidatus Aenigmarchaeota archaeon]